MKIIRENFSYSVSGQAIDIFESQFLIDIVTLPIIAVKLTYNIYKYRVLLIMIENGENFLRERLFQQKWEKEKRIIPKEWEWKVA